MSTGDNKALVIAFYEQAPRSRSTERLVRSAAATGPQTQPQAAARLYLSWPLSKDAHEHAIGTRSARTDVA